VANILHDAPLRWNPAHICVCFIFLETRIIGLHFAANGVDISWL